MQIGIIGLGDMGRLYARTFAAAGYAVCGTDLSHLLKNAGEELIGSGVVILPDGHEVSRRSDLILYCVEAEKVGQVVAEYAKSTKYGAIVGGQTSVKFPEIEAFETYLPKDAQIITCHALHGPGFETKGQSMALVRHRATDEAYRQAFEVFSSLESHIIEIASYQEHDRIMADTQALTHMGFESMGSAWKNTGAYPWDNPVYAGGIDNVKVLITLRIFSYKSHIYAGLAILNPYAREQVRVYAKTESKLFSLMLEENEAEFRRVIYQARDYVFNSGHELLFLNKEVMEKFSLADKKHIRKPNSHLSILSMVAAWHAMGVNPYKNLLCQTPPFRLRLGIAEYLFKDDELLEETIQAALYDKSIRKDDLEFHTAVHEWASIIEYGDMKGYKAHFEAAKTFFNDRLVIGRQLSGDLIRQLTE